MRDANRLRRLVWSGPAPAGVASRPRTRAASGLRLAANTSRPPGAWLTETVHGSGGHEKRGPTPKKTSDGAPEGATPFARRRAHQGLSRHPARRPLACPVGKRGNLQNSGVFAPRERLRLSKQLSKQWKFCEMENSLVPANQDQLTPEQEERVFIAVQRARANFLSFWARCSKTICRKAHKCSADPDICMGHLGPDVPDDVRNAADALIFGKFSGLSFEEVLVKAPRELSACLEWSRTPFSGRPRPRESGVSGH
jgi:hypothetical protein